MGPILTPQLDLDLMVARGAAIFGAGKRGVHAFLHDGDDKEMLNVSAADVLPGRVVLAEQTVNGQLRYTDVRSMCIMPRSSFVCLIGRCVRLQAVRWSPLSF